MERVVYINGEIPFEDARNISFTRLWADGGEPKVDNQGNEIVAAGGPSVEDGVITGSMNYLVAGVEAA